MADPSVHNPAETSTLDSGTISLAPGVEDPAATLAPDDGPMGRQPRPQQGSGLGIAGRYETFERLGAGANGRVYRAHDRITGDEVAVKMVPVPTAQDLDRIRAEITALRWLRLPGIAALRDDGVQDGEVFVVMELVRGQPFLGPTHRPWSHIAGQVLTLVETLARVHLAGVVHRDLKPANVLLDAHGQPVLVDFGLARGQALSHDWNRAGTPRYVAPEQAMGEPCGPQADLYALGIMIYEALSGGLLPQPGTGVRQILRARVHDAPRPLSEVAPDVPASVAAVVDRMVARQPDQRPRSALDVLQALGGRPPVALGHNLQRVLGTRRRVPAEDLRALFAGPDLFLHLREDAADVLWARTGGYAAQVAEELDAWVQAGLCTWEGPLLRIDRIAIERLRTGVALAVAAPPPPTLGLDALTLLDVARRAWPDTTCHVLRTVAELDSSQLHDAVEDLVRAGLAWPLADQRLGLRPVARPVADPYERAVQAEISAVLPADSDGRLRHVVASGADAGAVLPVARRVVERLLGEGKTSSALAVLELALPLARQGGLADEEEALLVAWARVALAQERPSALERALYELGRAQHRTVMVERVEELLYAGRVRFTDEPQRCRALLDKVAPFADEELEVWRVALTYAAARLQSVDAAAALVDGLDEWARAGSALRATKLMNWRGLLAYARGEYRRAADLQLAVAERADSPPVRLGAATNAAFALLDGGELERAREVAAEVYEEAAKLRQTLLEARAMCVLRQVQYRCGEPGKARPEVVEAADHLERRMGALFCFSEVGFAMRAGDAWIAARLARHGASGFKEAGFEPAELLFNVVDLWMSGQLGDGAAQAAADRARSLPDLSFSVQVLGIVRLATVDRVVDRATMEAVVGSGDFEDPLRVIDLLSVREALDGRLHPLSPTETQ